MTPNQNLKEVLKWAADFGELLETALEDKKITLQEVIGFLPSALKISELIPKLKAAKDEWLNADSDSKADIVKYAETEFDFSNEKTERIVEKVIGFLAHAGSLVQEFIQKDDDIDGE